MTTNAPNIPIRILVFGLVTWVAVSLLGFFYGPHLIEFLAPFYEWVIESIDPNYDARIYFADDAKGQASIVLAATALKTLQLVEGMDIVAAGRTLESSVTVLHTLVPLVIFIVTLIIFPMNHWKQRLLCIAFMIPGIFIISALTAPIQLLGQVEIAFINAAAKFGVVRESPWTYDWFIATEGGARWLIGVIVGVVVAVAARAVPFEQKTA